MSFWPSSSLSFKCLMIKETKHHDCFKIVQYFEWFRPGMLQNFENNHEYEKRIAHFTALWYFKRYWELLSIQIFNAVLIRIYWHWNIERVIFKTILLFSKVRNLLSYVRTWNEPGVNLKLKGKHKAMWRQLHIK